MPFRFSDNIDRKPYVGSTEIAEAYVGITKIYPDWGWFIEKYPYDGFHYKLRSNKYVVVMETYDINTSVATGLIILDYDTGKVVKEYHSETMYLSEHNFAANIDVWLDADGSICWLDDDANIVKSSPIYSFRRYVFKDSAGYVYATKKSDIVTGNNVFRGTVTRTLFNADGTVAEETTVKNSSVWYMPENNQASFAAVDNGSDVNYSRAIAKENYTYAIVSSANQTNQVMLQKISLDGQTTVVKIGDYYTLDVFKDPTNDHIIAGRNASPTAYKITDDSTTVATATGLTSFFGQSSSYGKRITVSKVYDYVNDITYLSMTANGGNNNRYNGLYTYEENKYVLQQYEENVVRYMQIGNTILKIVAKTVYSTTPDPVTYDVYSLSPVENEPIWNWTKTHQFTFTAEKILGSVTGSDSYDVFCFTGKNYFIINNYKIKYVPERGNNNNEETPEEEVNDGE